jgi:hypothetical protein
MKELKLLIKDVERELLANLLVSLKYRRLSKSEAKKVAGDFVTQRFNTHDDLFSKLYLMSDSYQEARKVFVKYAPDYFTEIDLDSLNLVRHRLRDVSKGDEENGR